MAAFASAFQPVGRTRADRKRQFDTGCATGASNHGDFWVAVYMLGIDAEVGALEALMQAHGAPASVTTTSSKDRTGYSRVLGSLRNVRKAWGHDFWHRLDAIQVTLPTVPPVSLAAGLSRLAKAHALDEAATGLQHALTTKRPGPTTAITSALGVRTVQNADVDVAIGWLTIDNGGQHDAPDQAEAAPVEGHLQPRARKRRRASVASPERPRRHRHTAPPSAPSPLPWVQAGGAGDVDVDKPPDSPATPPPPPIDPLLPSPSFFLNAPARSRPTPGQLARLPPMARLSTPHPRGHAAGPDPRPRSPVTDAHDTRGSNKHAIVVQAHNELHRDLEIAYAAAKKARAALERAEAKLAQVQQQIQALPTMSLAPAPTDAHQPALLHRVDGSIHALEEKKALMEQQVAQYTELCAQMTPHFDTYGPKPIDPAVYQRNVAGLEQPLQELRNRRTQLQAAEDEVSHLRADYMAKKREFQELRSAWKAMQNAMEEWDPSDDDMASEAELE